MTLFLLIIYSIVLVEISFFSIKIISEEENLSFPPVLKTHKAYLFFFILIISSLVAYKNLLPIYDLSSINLSIFVSFSFATLFALSFIDLKTLYVPDDITFLALALSLICIDDINKILSGGLGVLFLYLLTKTLSSILKKEVMGSGDLTIAATSGVLLGLPAFFVSIAGAGILSVLFSIFLRKKTLPFVPFITSSAFLCYLFDAEVTHFIYLVQTGGLIG